MPNDLTSEDNVLPAELEKAIDKAIRNCLKDQPGELPSYMRTPNARIAFQAAFETIGGMPRLAIWAHQNYGRFLQLYSRLLPLTVSGDGEHPITINAPWLTNSRFNSQVTVENEATALPSPSSEGEADGSP